MSTAPGLTGTTSALVYATVPARVEKGAPAGYRLVKKPNGEMVLQGMFCWYEGSKHGHEWRDIPTVNGASIPTWAWRKAISIFSPDVNSIECRARELFEKDK